MFDIFPWFCIAWLGNHFLNTIYIYIYVYIYIHKDPLGWLRSRWWLFNNHPVFSMAILGLDGLIFPQDVHKLQDVWKLKISPHLMFLEMWRGILFGGSWQMGQTRHGLMGPKSWVRHSGGIWKLHLFVEFDGRFSWHNWFSSCGFVYAVLKAAVLDLFTFKKECSKLCLYLSSSLYQCYFTFKNQKHWQSLYQENEWFMKYLLQIVRCIHSPFCFFDIWTGSVCITMCLWKTPHPMATFSTKEIQESGDDSRQSGTSKDRFPWLPRFGGHFYGFYSTGQEVCFWGGTCQLEANGPKIVNFREILRFWF